jgi:hypothetical protein
MTEENNVTELPIAAGPGRDRREHNRWRIEGAMAQTDGRDWPLVDISIGGFQARDQGEQLTVGEEINGVILWATSTGEVNLEFKARLVRAEPQAGLFAAAFEILEGPQIDRLLNILSGIDSERRSQFERLDRSRRRRQMIGRIGSFIAVLAGIAVVGAGAWFFLQG